MCVPTPPTYVDARARGASERGGCRSRSLGLVAHVTFNEVRDEPISRGRPDEPLRRRCNRRGTTVQLLPLPITHPQPHEAEFVEVIRRPGTPVLLIGQDNKAAPVNRVSAGFQTTLDHARELVATPTHPAATYAITLREGAFAADFDLDGDRGAEAIERLHSWCVERRVAHWVVASGRHGHGWVIAALYPQLVGAFKAVARGLGVDTVREPGHRLRPPGSPHRLGTHRATVVFPADPAEAVSMMTSALRDVSAVGPASAAQSGDDAAGDNRSINSEATGVPGDRSKVRSLKDGPGPVRRSAAGTRATGRTGKTVADLRGPYFELAAHGSGPLSKVRSTGEGLDRSAAGYDLALHCAYQRWSVEDFVAAATNRDNKGLERFWSRKGGAADAHRQFRKAETWVAQHPPRLRATEPTLISSVSRFLDACEAAAWPPRLRGSGLAVAQGLANVALDEARGVELRVSVRKLSEAAGIAGHGSVQKALRFLTDEKLIEQTDEFGGDESPCHRYLLSSPQRSAAVAPDPSIEPVDDRGLSALLDHTVSHDVFTAGRTVAHSDGETTAGGLGKDAWLVYRALAGGPVTLTELAASVWEPTEPEPSARALKNTARALARLQAAGLATERKRGWGRTNRSLDGAARQLGCNGRGAMLRRRHAKERKAAAKVTRPRKEVASVPRAA